MAATWWRSIAAGVVLAACLPSCGGEPPGSPDPGAGVAHLPPRGEGSSDETTTQLRGTFALNSAISLGDADFSGSSTGEVINLLEALGSEPKGLAKYVVDRLIDGAAFPFRPVLKALRSQLIDLVHAPIDQLGPSLAADLQLLARDVAALARRYRFSSTLSGSSSAGSSAATFTHRVDTITWTLGNRITELNLAEELDERPQASGITLTVDSRGHLAVSRHELAWPVGLLLVAGLEAVAIPRLDPKAHSLAQWFIRRLECTRLGKSIADRLRITYSGNTTLLQIGTAKQWRQACESAAKSVAKKIDKMLASDDAAKSTLTLAGRAAAADTDHDGRLDAISAGFWSGELQLAGAKVEVEGRRNTFGGKRAR